MVERNVMFTSEEYKASSSAKLVEKQIRTVYAKMKKRKVKRGLHLPAGKDKILASLFFHISADMHLS